MQVQVDDTMDQKKAWSIAVLECLAQKKYPIKYATEGQLSMLVVNLLKCLWSKKELLLIWKAFQSIEEWPFSFKNIFFRFRDIYVFVSKLMTS